jgi:hypothetical protein
LLILRSLAIVKEVLFTAEPLKMTPKGQNFFILDGLSFQRPLDRPKFRWENNIKMDLGEMGLGAMDGTHQAGLEAVD